MALRPGSRLGAYEIVSPLGAGGMGEVYRARHLKLGRDAAIKVLPGELGSDSERRETVSFRASYGNERVIAQPLLPKDAAPPYQAVVWFPANDAFSSTSSESPASTYLFDFVPRSGRALVYPVYKGMYERRAPFARSPNEWRDTLITWSKDLRRSRGSHSVRPTRDHPRGARLARPLPGADGYGGRAGAGSLRGTH